MRYSSKYALAALMAFHCVMLTYCQAITQHEGCPAKCGNVTIPYPFGIGENCAFNKNFILYCNQTNNPPTPSLSANGSLAIIDISVDGYLRKYTYVAHDCYNQMGGDRNYFNAQSTLAYTLFYSSTQNKFTAIGCDTRSELDGTIRGAGGTQIDPNGRAGGGGFFASGCISYCINASTVSNGSCSGIGCCQTAVPSGLSSFNVTLGSYRRHTLVHNFNPCSYAFIADRDYFNFTVASLQKMPKVVPTVVDWVIANISCATAQKNASTYGCKSGHSECTDYGNGLGYRCNCSSGYAGNPYLPGGCLDVDECKNENECTHKCHNLEGKYRCSCPRWYHGDGKRSGEGCKLRKHSIILVLVGDGILLAAVVAGILFLHNQRRKRMEAKLKEKFFKKNGGFKLLERIGQNIEDSNSIRPIIFGSEQLKKATSNFSADNVCGQGGYGTVYKGRLSNGSIVAIKKSKEINKHQVGQFINEIIILSQIGHKNVVKFLGCCLEEEVPWLVYEFVTNGTLSDHIHNQNINRPKMLWETRLKIATETAGLLAYLHTDHKTQIIHRDIKPSNILLDDEFTPKISDFGISRLNPKNEIEICTEVVGTIGYVDPEYLQTKQLTEKCDVYSFGVVLMELLTGLKALSYERPEEDRNLVLYLMSLTKEDHMLRILDKALIKEENIHQIKQVLKIAKMCVRVKGEERPTMREVAMELEGLHKNTRHQGDHNEAKFEESENLRGELSSNQSGDSIEMTGYSNRPEHLPLNVNEGR